MSLQLSRTSPTNNRLITEEYNRYKRKFWSFGGSLKPVKICGQRHSLKCPSQRGSFWINFSGSWKMSTSNWTWHFVWQLTSIFSKPALKKICKNVNVGFFGIWSRQVGDVSLKVLNVRDLMEALKVTKITNLVLLGIMSDHSNEHNVTWSRARKLRVSSGSWSFQKSAPYISHIVQSHVSYILPPCATSYAHDSAPPSVLAYRIK